MDTLLHLGTMTAIVAYFRHDIWELVVAGWQGLRQRAFDDPQTRLAWGILLGTIPAAAIGLLLEDFVVRLFDMPRAAAGFLLGTAALLLLSEYLARQQRDLTSISWRDAFLIGLSQMLAIAPGVSRSGSTIAAGLLLGYQREDATRFSFFLAVPIILGSGLYQVVKILNGSAGMTPSSGVMALGFLASALTGYAAIAGLLAFVRRRNLWPFAAYCTLLGGLVLTGVLG